MKVACKDVICRANCASNGKNLGRISGEYTILEIQHKGETTWYRIGDNQWVDASLCEVTEECSQENVNNVVDDVDEYESDLKAKDEESAVVDTSDEVHSVETLDDSTVSATMSVDAVIADSKEVQVGDLIIVKAGYQYADCNSVLGVTHLMEMARVLDIVSGQHPIKIRRCNSEGKIMKNSRTLYIDSNQVTVCSSLS